MFNQLIKNLNTSPINMLDSVFANKQTQQTAPQTQVKESVDFQRTIEIILRILSSSLSQKLGEAVDQNQWRELAGELARSRGMQQQLVETKERYNDLVNKVSGLMQQARRISTAIADFVFVVNKLLESEEMMVPLRDIQKGINQLSAERVEKQVSYLTRIFQQNFQQVIQRKVSIVEVSLLEQIKLLKNLNKNLEGELLAIKNNRNSQQSKVYELSMRISTLNEKMAKLSTEKADLQNGIKAKHAIGEQKQQENAQLQRQLTRLRAREGQLLQKLKVAESKINRSQRSLKEQSSQAEALNAVIQKLKAKHQEVVEQLEQEARRKELASEALRKKLQSQKFMLQEQIEHHRERYGELEATLVEKQQEIVRLKEEIKNSKERGDFQIDLTQPIASKQEQKVQQQGEVAASQVNQAQVEAKKISLNQLMLRLTALQTQKKGLEAELGKAQTLGVNKQVLKTLFLSYDDESKEWSVRKNIKQQIYSLLDLKEKLAPVQEVKPSKWFGLF